MKWFKRILVLLLGIVCCGFSSALTLKAAIGVGAWDALAQTGNYMTGIEVGTVGMCFNFICIAVQIIVLKKKFRPIQLLQIPLSILLGVIVNFALYDVYCHFTIDNYAINVVLLIVGYIVAAFAVGWVMVLDIVTFALEGACMAVSKVTGKEFHKLRQAVDIASIIVVLVVSVIFSLEFSIREGTIIGMLIFGPMMGIFMREQKKVFKKLDLIDYD